MIVVLKTVSPCSSVTDIDPPPSDDPCRPNSCATKAGAGFKSLKDTWADTTTPHGRLMLTVLGSLAEFEGELIRARTDDGRRRAKSRGVKFGRPNALTPHQRQEARSLLTALCRLIWPALSRTALIFFCPAGHEFRPPADAS